MTSVTIPNSVTEIGSSAFYDCTGLTSVTIPNSVTSIGYYAFYNTPWYNNQPDGVVYINNVLYKYKGTMPSGTSIDIKDGTVSITSSAFYYCTGLTLVTIPNSVTEIGSSAFYNCTGLTSVTIPNSVTSIGSSAFSGCTGLKSVTIGNSVTEIGGSAFYNCTGLTTVNFNATNCTSMGSSSYPVFSGCTKFTTLNIGDNVTNIPDYAFRKCTGLTSVTIPNSVTSIGSSAFYKCTGLTSVTIPNSVTSIGEHAFMYCSGLTEVTIPNSVTSIGSSAFSGCTGLTKTTIEKGNDSISINSKEVFSCKKVYIGRPLKYINSDYATNYNLFNTVSELTIDYEIAELTDYMFKNCTKLKVLSVGKGDSELKIGYLERNYYNEQGKGLFYNLPLDSVYIGRPISYNATKQYGYSPFAGIKTLKHIVLDCNNMDVTLTSYFFEACDSIETISIQNSHQQMSLPAELFKGCANLKSLTLPFPGAGTAQTTSNFGELFGTKSNSDMRAVTQLFEDGTKKTYYLPTGLEELILTEGCEMIPYGGLYNCNMLKRLTLPTSLYMVGDKALYGCAQISDIYCKGADPAVAYDSSFDGMRLTSCKLHVPYNSSERYKISDGWKRFYYIEEEAPLVISIAKSIENAGVVYGINEYQPGQVAEIEAVAHSGYTFVGWYENGNLLTTDSKYTIMVTDSHSLVAMFAPVLDENEVEVAPQDKNVTLSWAQETGATYYNIDIYFDVAMTMQVGSIVVDNTGQPVSRSTSTVSATIDGLSEMQNYYYSISAIGDDDVVLSKYIGSFSTSAGINNIYYNDDATEVARYDIYGHKLSEPTKGINIVKYSDGTVKKMIIKK